MAKRELKSDLILKSIKQGQVRLDLSPAEIGEGYISPVTFFFNENILPKGYSIENYDINGKIAISLNITKKRK